MRENGQQEKPLQGAVVCCTSIAPELRSRYAEYILQMGAEHKLDLTSDVTHLLVGDTDTPKYRYVAKEREDVKVLKPEWVEAVRRRWMADEAINLNELDHEHRVPTLAGLKICITGFDDLTFRAQLQKNVIENGGQYTGDLTKDVTHLIAARASGKKYEYGTQWQKKVVSLQWYRDTLDRGMQLDESSYHPSISDDDQGKGAWNRAVRKPSPGMKRNRDDSQLAEQPRKLRRTASARFTSQNDTMWSDIVKNEAADDTVVKTKKLQVSRSVPDLQQQRYNQSETDGSNPRRKDVFSGSHFTLQGFSAQHEPILKSVLLSHGGAIVSTLVDLRAVEESGTAAKVLLLPHQTSLEQIPAPGEGIDVASELWVEHCMFSKKFYPPQTYLLGCFLPRIKPPGFSKLIITSTGFAGIVPNHIAKIVRQLGAKYEQTFKADASVLICNSQGYSQQKVELAQSWRIPTVSESWLQACIKQRRQVSFEKHALPIRRRPHSSEPQLSQDKRKVPAKTTAAITGGSVSKEHSRTGDETGQLTHRQPGESEIEHADADDEGFILVDDAPARVEATSGGQNCVPVHSNEVAGGGSACTRLDTRHIELESRPPAALRAISPNLSPKRRKHEGDKPKKRLFQAFDGPADDTENMISTRTPTAAVDTTHAPVNDAQTLNGEIQELLDLKSKLMERRCESTSTCSRPKKQLMGRALSNLSNTSSVSHIRQSRAGSVDSVNTDGIGREIGLSAPEESKSKADEPAVNPSFTGRATSKLLESRTTSLGMMAASAVDSDDAQYIEAAPEPALTQLVYEDPEEVLQSREKLAAKRRQRQRSKLGEKEGDHGPTTTRSNTPAKRIKDDDVLVGAGWGAGRRTRNKPSPSGGMKDF